MDSYPVMNSRIVWLTEVDWRNFTDMVAEAFPTVRYYDDLTYAETVAAARPERPVYKSLFETRNAYTGHFVEGCFDPDWRPPVMQQPNSSRPGHMEWVQGNSPNPSFLLHMTRPMWTTETLKTAPFMEFSQITFYSDRGNEEQRRMAMLFFRLLGKVCTNRNQMQISMPGRELLCHGPKGSLFWLGHDAIRWAREDPQRVLFYNDRTWALRPDDMPPPAPKPPPKPPRRKKAG